MPFSLPNLPFDSAALEPWCSAETFSYHHGKHHAAYVAKLNAALENSDLAGQPLEEIIAATRDGQPSIFNNAAQHFNHAAFWESLSPETQEPGAKILELIGRDFGSFDAFREEYTRQAASLFGSGWVWLVLTAAGKLEIRQCANAETPAGTADRGLLPLDVWEHAYYIDHRNDRTKFIEGFWTHINWRTVEQRLE